MDTPRYLPDHHSALVAMISLWMYKHIDDIYKLMNEVKNKTTSVNDKVSIYSSRNFLGETIYMKLDVIFLGFNEEFIEGYEIDLVHVASQVTHRYCIRNVIIPKIRLSHSALAIIFK